jgi:5-enolpyruvylshikimate-3-phosphate synthase
VCNESSGASGECCCTGTLSAEDEIRMLEAMKTLEKIRLNGIDRRIEDLRKTVKE